MHIYFFSPFSRLQKYAISTDKSGEITVTVQVNLNWIYESCWVVSCAFAYRRCWKRRQKRDKSIDQRLNANFCTLSSSCCWTHKIPISARTQSIFCRQNLWQMLGCYVTSFVLISKLLNALKAWKWYQVFYQINFDKYHDYFLG